MYYQHGNFVLTSLQMTEKKRLTRSFSNRFLGGVCGGLGEYFGIDPILVRAFFVLIGLNGIGIPVYFVLWLLIPTVEKMDRETEDIVQNNLEDMRAQFNRLLQALGQPHPAAIVGALLIVAGLYFFLSDFLPTFTPAIFWAALFIGLGIFILTNKE